MYRIMLADDEGIVIDSLKFIIQKHFDTDCIVDFAKTGRSVIELAEHFRPDIAIMDIQMPGINGIDAMREIIKINPSTIFIVMSAYDKFDYAKEAINLGVLDYLNKPVDQSKIVEVLQKAMHMIDAERERRSEDLLIREKMETVVPIIENGLIYSILFQEHFEKDIDNFKHLLGIEEDYGYMLVMVCGEAQEGNYMTNAVGASIRAQSEYHELREIVKEFFPCIMGSVMANKVAAFVPCKESSLDYNGRIAIIEKARELARKMKKRIDVQFRIGIGSVKKLTASMESYQEALTSLVNTTGTVAHVGDLPLVLDYEADYPIETEKTLFEKTEKGDVDGAQACASQFFDWMIDKYGDYMTDIKLKCLEFVLWAEHLAYETGGMTYHFRSRQDYLPTLMAIQNYDEMRNWFVSKVTEASRNVTAKKEEQSSGVITKAKNYIDTHYIRDISLDDVSREVEISPYYFSKLFKEETGENFIEYVTNIRMEHAKKLLSSSELSMKEICGEIGYADPNYFSRIFKKNIGVTPTEFKEGNSV